MYIREWLKFGRPKFKLADEMINEILIAIYSKQNSLNLIYEKYLYYLNSILSTPGVDIGSLLIKQKLNPLTSYKSDNPIVTLINQYTRLTGNRITTWVDVKYLKTTSGNILLPFFVSQTIDRSYYTNRLKKYFNELTSIPVFF